MMRRTRSPGPTIAWLLVAGLVFGPTAVAASSEAASTPGWHRAERFTLYSPLASKWALASRTLAPTTFARLQRFEAATGTDAVEHTVDLADERFDVFVPSRQPADGYGLLVFVAPMPEWHLPRSWRSELDARGIVFVVARRSGNDEPVYDRRLPLALHAFENMHGRLPIDAARVYVGGFSGGARVAQRLAMSYPDVFVGALLLAGSQPFGAPGLFGEPWALPPEPWATRFMRDTRLVLASGTMDLVNRAHDADAAESLRAHCVEHVALIRIPRLDHWVPEGRYFRRVMDALETSPPAGAHASGDACRTTLRARAAEAMDRAERLLDAGRPAQAGALLAEAEGRYGGLAAPRSLALADRIAAALVRPTADAAREE